ncbi:glutathione S-transferase family protein [Pseudooceanicola nanhaiensis]|uniref:glutathione S-transferase family protein n=1 Tax=Pseudooceanicola nanhaiensis TaxID=375761 RepID=UPI004058EEA3
MIQLWHCNNARSFRALWALEELGLDYELKMLPFPPRVLQKAFLAENPLGTVPLLVDGETRMTESCAIPVYLAMRHGGGRFTVAPGHPEYGAYLNWLHHADATLTFPQTLVLRYGRLEPEERRQPQVVEDYTTWFLARLWLAEACLSDGRDHLLEDGFTMADIAVAFAVQFARSLGLGEALPPACSAWFDRLTLRPGYVRAMEAQRAAGAATGIAPAV